jgi:hypothetical protein
VAGDHRTVLAHNGVLFSMPHGDNRSDTRYLSEYLLKRAGFSRFDNKRVRRAFERWLGDRNKVAVLTTSPRYQAQAYLFNEAQGTWTDGEWHSNESWKKPAYTTHPASAYKYQRYTPATPNSTAAIYAGDPKPDLGDPSWRKDPRWVEVTPGKYQWQPRMLTSGEADSRDELAALAGFCQICETENSVEFGFCQLCKACEDCYESIENCDCYTPASLRRKAERDDDDGDLEGIIDGIIERGWDRAAAQAFAADDAA